MDVALRLFVLSAFASTCAVCFWRAAYTREQRALVGNIAFASVCGVAWYSQVALLNAPATTTTWLLAGSGCVCIAYLIVVLRKGPK